MDVFDLGDTFNFRNDNTCHLNKTLACDRFMVVTVFMVAAKQYNRWDSLMEHVRSCIFKADGLLADENSLRELFYESIGQWCEDHMSEDIGKGFMKNANGQKVADACHVVSKQLLRSSRALRNLFSGTKMSKSTILSVEKEAKKMIDQIGKIGPLELCIYTFLLKSALHFNKNNVKL